MGSDETGWDRIEWGLAGGEAVGWNGVEHDGMGGEVDGVKWVGVGASHSCYTRVPEPRVAAPTPTGPDPPAIFRKTTLRLRVNSPGFANSEKMATWSTETFPPVLVAFKLKRNKLIQGVPSLPPQWSYARHAIDHAYSRRCSDGGVSGVAGRPGVSGGNAAREGAAAECGRQSECFPIAG